MNKVAYEMASTTSLTSAQQAELWYKALLMLDGGATFDACRTALVTAANIITIYVNYENEPILPEYWYSYSIQQALETGIMSGYPDGTIQADKTVTLAEFLVIMEKAFYYGISEEDVTDIPAEWQRICKSHAKTVG